jgi:hypothetical protein
MATATEKAWATSGNKSFNNQFTEPCDDVSAKVVTEYRIIGD